MAVYTQLGAEAIAALVGAYDIGALVSAKGIAEGVSNSNWLIETTGADSAGANRGARFILTLYERRIDLADLPFFLGLLDHLAAEGCPVPATIHDRAGAAIREVAGKKAALIEFLPGISPTRPNAAQAHAVGAALAQVHLAAQDFPLRRANALDITHTARALERCGAQALGNIDPMLAGLADAAAGLAARWPHDLPRSICHTDLFPDNVLLRGDDVAGLIDFYFAAEEAMAYDLAVTHAAWCFDPAGTRFEPELGSALIAGYDSRRPLEPHERACLPLLAEGACLRFVASRAEDWLDTPTSAQVARKDPLDFARRWRFYAENGAQAFA